MLYMETHSTDPFYNLAFEEYQLIKNHNEDVLILWQNASTVVIGLNQNIAEEVDLEYAHKHNISVVRRTTGGGAVYHDLGNLNYSFITDVNNEADLSLSYFSGLVCKALQRMGVPAEPGGRNDILVEGKKISGSAQRLMGNRILHHGCIMFNADRATMAKVLSPDPLKFISKSSKSVRSRTVNVSDFLCNDFNTIKFWDSLRLSLTGDKAQLYELSEEETLEIAKLANKKFRTREWNYGNSPEFTVSSKAKFPGGLIEFKANVTNGKIKSIAFFGDYLARKDQTDIISSLKDVWFAPDSIRSAFAHHKLSDYFGEISCNELITLMFGICHNDR